MAQNKCSSEYLDVAPVSNSDHEKIQSVLQKILASTEFHATRQQRDFLTFVVTELLAGRGEDLKGYTIATQVFRRPADFDSSIDPIVSIQANKLRRALERYYFLDGKDDQIRIDIPKGTYVPRFLTQPKIDSQDDRDPSEVDHLQNDPWPTLAILPFLNRTNNPEMNLLATGIPTELAIELSRYENMQVFYPRDGIPADVQEPISRFVLHGEIYRNGKGITLDISIVDTKTNRHLWGEVFRTEINLDDIFRLKEQVVYIVAAQISGQFGVIPRTISLESRSKPPSRLSTYEAILRHYEYEQNMTPECFRRAFDALTQAEKDEPESAQVTCSLAQLYATIYNLDIAGFNDPLDKAVEYAERAVIVNPNNQRTLTILAYIRFVSNELLSAQAEARRALRLNPHSLFILDGIAYILTLCGDWEDGPRLAEKAVRLNPYHRAVTHDALWVNYLRQKKYKLAKVECSSRQRPALFWDPLMKAASFGLLGQKEQGEKCIEKLLMLRPDFPSKGKALIRNYIKFEEIALRIEEGLHSCGLRF